MIYHLHKKLNDIEIIEACKKGSRQHQQVLYKKYYPLMSNIALRYCSSVQDAEEGINFGFLKVLNALYKYDNQFSIATFIRTILVRHFIDIYRKKHNAKNLPIILLKDSAVQSVTNYGYENLTNQDLLNTINKLPQTQKTVFNLFAIDGYTHAEIGTMLGCTEGTSRWHLNQARATLQKLINQQNQLLNKIVKTP